MYSVVGTYLLEAIAEVLKGGGHSFEGPLKEAWVRGYWSLAYIFIDKEAELYKGAGWLGWKEFKVAKRVKESEDITSFYLRPADDSQLNPYKPGLYISVRFTVDELGYKQSRQ
jgi:nitric oxide dioxygenase